MNPDVLDDFLTQSEYPREISFFSQLVILFNGLLPQIAWAFVAFFSVFFWAFTIQSEFTEWFRTGGDWVGEVPGKVVSFKATGNSENEQTIYRIHFSYSVNGVDYEDSSYTKWDIKMPDTAVNVEYKENDPSQARIIGHRTRPFGTFVGILMSIFFLATLVVAVIVLKTKYGYLKLLRYGHLAKGKQVRKEPGGGRVNDQVIYKYIFQFNVGKKSYNAKCKTHHTHRVEDEEKETILYNEKAPQTNLVLDALPGGIKVKDGMVVPESPSRYLVLLLPFFTIVINVLVYLFLFPKL